MSTWQERLKAEYEELKERTDKLFSFTETLDFEELPNNVQFIMEMQHVTMKNYLLLLEMRLALLEDVS